MLLRVRTHAADEAQLRDRVGLSGPYQWIAGIEGVEGWNVSLRSGPKWGPCTANLIEERGEYKKGDDAEESLRPFLQKVFDQCGALSRLDQRHFFTSGSETRSHSVYISVADKMTRLSRAPQCYSFFDLFETRCWHHAVHSNASPSPRTADGRALRAILLHFR
jgi:hypothetical protein